MKSTKIILAIIIISVLAVFAYFALPKNSREAEAPSTNLGARVNDEGGVSIEVLPVDFSASKPLKLQISFTTHQGDLNFDLTRASYLLDDKGNKYLPISWDGGSGGHHLSGILYFSEPIGSAESMEFVVENVYNIEKRKFLWELK